MLSALPTSSPSTGENAVARWLHGQRPLMHRVVLWTLHRMALPAPFRVRRVLLADIGLHEDIVAEAMLTYLCRWRAGAVQEGKERPFVCAIVANLTRTRARVEVRTRVVAEDDDVSDIADVVPTAAPSPEDAALNRERLLGLRRALDQLGDRERRVLAIAVDEGVAAAATATGIPEATVRVIVHRARKKLSALMGDDN